LKIGEKMKRILSFVLVLCQISSVENGQEILLKALEAGVILLIFKVAMPHLISSVAGKVNYDESRFYQFITKKWGGKAIKTPDVKPDVDPDMKPDTDPNVENGGYTDVYKGQQYKGNRNQDLDFTGRK
jgi:hypothetical protein